MKKDPLPEISPWPASAPETLVETRVFSLRRKRATSPTRPERSGEFVYIDAPDWVNVIALNDSNDVVLIEQYRHGIEEVTLEIPGGMIDPGEEPLGAGLRELREETGFEGSGARLIGSVTPNPAIINNRCHTVLVRGVERRNDPCFEGLEEIRTKMVPLSRVPSLIRSGAIDHALVIAAFHHLYLEEA